MQINFSYYKPQALITSIIVLGSVSSWGLSKLCDYNFLQGIGPTTIVMGFLYVYDKYLWKLPVFKMINTVPNLNGVYEGEIEYYYNDENNKKKCRLEIKQTCSSIKVKSSFNKEGENETHSESTVALIKTDEVGDQHLYIYYRNPGSQKNGDSLNSHDGMNVLEILKKKKNITIKGYYFTNRDPQTKGRMEVIKINKGDK